MRLNNFANLGIQPFKNVEEKFNISKISSLWNGESIKSFFKKSSDKLSSFSIEKFFSDGLAYSLDRAKEISSDLTVDPTTEKFDTVVKSTKFNLKKFATIGFATIALQMTATALHNTQTPNEFISSNSSVMNQYNPQSQIDVNSFSNSSLSGIKTINQINQVGNPNNLFILNNQIDPLSKTSEFAKFFTKSISNPNPIENLRVDAPKAAVKIPKYMQSMFKSKDEAFLHLLNVAEGKQSKFYRDNKGIAIAYGWNPTRNSKEFNLSIAQKAGLDQEQTEAILKVSDTNKVNYVPKNLRKIKLTEEQLDKTAIALMPHYEEDFLNAMTEHSLKHGRDPEKDIAAYKQLPNNQQAVMIHMAYKVGGDNLANYKTFYKKLFKYLDSPNKSNLNQVQKNFTYTYSTLDGQRLHDSRVEDIHTGFFSDCSVQVDPKAKEKVSSKINQCRNVANITDKEKVQEMRTQVATIQNKMFKMLG